MRRRTRSQSQRHICRFESCGATLSSAAALTAHETAHDADKPLQCTSTGCTARFATSADREEHMGVAHRKRRRKRRRSEDNGAVLALEEEQLPEEEGDIDVKNGAADKEAESEANEIVENAAYLASQMKIARVRPSACVYHVVRRGPPLSDVRSLTNYLLLFVS